VVSGSLSIYSVRLGLEGCIPGAMGTEVRAHEPLGPAGESGVRVRAGPDRSEMRASHLKHWSKNVRPTVGVVAHSCETRHKSARNLFELAWPAGAIAPVKGPVDIGFGVAHDDMDPMNPLRPVDSCGASPSARPDALGPR